MCVRSAHTQKFGEKQIIAGKSVFSLVYQAIGQTTGELAKHLAHWRKCCSGLEEERKRDSSRHAAVVALEATGELKPRKVENKVEEKKKRRRRLQTVNASLAQSTARVQ